MVLFSKRLRVIVNSPPNPPLSAQVTTPAPSLLGSRMFSKVDSSTDTAPPPLMMPASRRPANVESSTVTVLPPAMARIPALKVASEETRSVSWNTSEVTERTAPASTRIPSAPNPPSPSIVTLLTPTRAMEATVRTGSFVWPVPRIARDDAPGPTRVMLPSSAGSADPSAIWPVTSSSMVNSPGLLALTWLAGSDESGTVPSAASIASRSDSVPVGGLASAVVLTVSTVGVNVPCTSTAPMSRPSPPNGLSRFDMSLIRGKPRWSVGNCASVVGLGPPASIAGLADDGTIVKVGPPLFWSGPSSGLIGALAVPIRLPLVKAVTPVTPAPSPIRLNELAALSGPYTSSIAPPDPVFWATIVLTTRAPTVTPT